MATLFNIIMDFFIINVFGGFDSNNVYHVISINGGFKNGVEYGIGTGNLTGIEMLTIYGEHVQVSLGNYLSLIATIITLVIILVICCLFIKKIITTFVRVAL